MPMTLNSATSLLKHGVMNDKGETLGKIDELLVDMDTGRIVYAVLTYGSFLGRGKVFAVPVELLRFSAHDKKYVLDLPKELFEKSAGYDSVDKVISNPDLHWLGDRYEYYSNTPEWEKRREDERQIELKIVKDKREEIKKSMKQGVMP
jgi:sporulation protein YlmC with PRC-barrel domain